MASRLPWWIYVFTNGVEEKDKLILGQKKVRQRLGEIDQEKRLLLKILDKGVSLLSPKATQSLPHITAPLVAARKL